MMVEFIHTLSGYLTDAVIFLRLLIESGKENITHFILSSWWRHQMEIFSVLLAICAGNSPVPGEFPAQRPVTRSFGVFFDLRLNKRLSKTTVRLVIWDAIAPIMTPP